VLAPLATIKRSGVHWFAAHQRVNLTRIEIERNSSRARTPGKPEFLYASPRRLRVEIFLEKPESELWRLPDQGINGESSYPTLFWILEEIEAALAQTRTLRPF